MKPQNESYIKNNCPNWLESAMNNFQEALANQSKPNTDTGMSPGQPDVEAHQDFGGTKKNEKNVMNPDDYFKGLICNALKIDVKNLHEPYFKKFLNQRKHNTQKIMESKERKELKFCKDLLKMKHKEVALKSGIEKDQGELKLAVQTDVAFRIYKKAYGDTIDQKGQPISSRAFSKTTRTQKRVTFSDKLDIQASPNKFRAKMPSSSNLLKGSAQKKVDSVKSDQENKRVFI
jgi:hypothetical protein